MLYLTDINASETALYTHFPFNFTKSLPECAKIDVYIDEYPVIKYLDSSPRYLTRISCDRIECDNDINIPDHIEKLDIKKCVLGTNKTLTLGKNCKSVKIMDMRGRLIIPGLMEGEMGLNTVCGILNFEYNTDETEKQRKLELCRSKNLYNSKY
ncbi:putative LRR containing protein [Trachipleistophora hominis]|uniref:Putative LRR containing protein n=1 Tax=Trachipleistophora hominis TaxID=72359 RepID=L7JZ80_TRAHO|nr:putative LRR containing protein [Trachipleistophora hominis]